MVNMLDSEFTIPHDVVGLNVIEGKSMVRAWREYKKVAHKEMAARMGITQAAYSRMEKPGANLRRATLKSIARAMNIRVEQLTE